MGYFCLCVIIILARAQLFLKIFCLHPGNSRLPELTQTNLVDIYLFRADSLEDILRFSNVTNPVNIAGSITAQVNDTWWGEQGNNWNGQNVSYPYYWVIIRSDKGLDGSEVPQPIFTAVRKFL